MSYEKSGKNRKNYLNESGHVNVSKSWKRGDWSRSLPAIALRQAQKNPSVKNISLALNVQHAIAGLDSASVECCSQLVIETLKKSHWSIAAVRILCAQLQLGKIDMAHAFVPQCLPGNCSLPRARLLNRFPTALRFLQEHYPQKLRNSQKYKCWQSEKLLEHIELIDELIVHSHYGQKQSAIQKITVALVGNGPSILDHPQGQYIDSHDVVIRFNRAVLTNYYKPYTGIRTSLQVLSPNLVKRTSNSDQEAMAISGINILQGESGYWNNLAKLVPRVRLAVFPQTVWYKLVEELNAPPSAGLLTLISLANLQGIEVSAFGFSKKGINSDLPSARTNDGLSRFHPSRNHYGDRKPASTRHNWMSEAQLITRLAESTANVRFCTE